MSVQKFAMKDFESNILPLCKNVQFQGEPQTTLPSFASFVQSIDGQHVNPIQSTINSCVEIAPHQVNSCRAQKISQHYNSLSFPSHLPSTESISYFANSQKNVKTNSFSNSNQSLDQNSSTYQSIPYSCSNSAIHHPPLRTSSIVTKVADSQHKQYNFHPQSLNTAPSPIFQQQGYSTFRPTMHTNECLDKIVETSTLINQDSNLNNCTKKENIPSTSTHDSTTNVQYAAPIFQRTGNSDNPSNRQSTNNCEGKLSISQLVQENKQSDLFSFPNIRSCGPAINLERVNNPEEDFSCVELKRKRSNEENNYLQALGRWNCAKRGRTNLSPGSGLSDNDSLDSEGSMGGESLQMCICPQSSTPVTPTNFAGTSHSLNSPHSCLSKHVFYQYSNDHLSTTTPNTPSTPGTSEKNDIPIRDFKPFVNKWKKNDKDELEESISTSSSWSQSGQDFPHSYTSKPSTMPALSHSAMINCDDSRLYEPFFNGKKSTDPNVINHYQFSQPNVPTSVQTDLRYSFVAETPLQKQLLNQLQYNLSPIHVQNKEQTQKPIQSQMQTENQILAHQQEHSNKHTKSNPSQASQLSNSKTSQKTIAHVSKLSSDIAPKKKRFICDICDKSFLRGADLRTHQRVHTKERPFHCSVCNKSFTTNSNMRRHALTHTGTRSFACKYCPKLFYQHSHLKRHMQIHSDIVK